MIELSALWEPIRLSLQTAVAALLIVFVAGTAAGWCMSRYTFRGKLIIETIFLLPTVLPPTVVGFLLITIFGTYGVVGNFLYSLFDLSLMFTWTAAVITAVIVAFPFMYQSVKVGLDSVDRDIENAARVDGASEWEVFLFISLPLSLKSIISGLVLSFSRALGEFGATFMFAGNIPGRTQTAPIAIFTAMEAGNMTLAWTLVIILVVLSFAMLLSIRTFAR
ncbi:molybdate ABC transporter permease subunit [Alteribacillus iranensis]|uniref:Molybdenum transport system permease n=1 Tax=Alteribacillus iranensis TaxID=930128 RepID=A0A1I1ZWW3_9BACI|nr:molybdate ABC transporter permease subunit [Alteribacillus iranensis]SFE36132.1 molybdate transport system permease protein [Alteribacillus iranensis]